MRISDWSSDVCSADLRGAFGHGGHRVHVQCTRQSKLEGDLVAYSLVLGRATDKDNAIHVLGAKLRLGHGFTHRLNRVRELVFYKLVQLLLAQRDVQVDVSTILVLHPDFHFRQTDDAFAARRQFDLGSSEEHTYELQSL